MAPTEAPDTPKRRTFLDRCSDPDGCPERPAHVYGARLPDGRWGMICACDDHFQHFAGVVARDLTLRVLGTPTVEITGGVN